MFKKCLIILSFVVSIFLITGCNSSHIHTYATETIYPTCTSQGYTIYTCECGHTYNDNYVSKIPHDYDTQIIPATCTSLGYTIYTCGCGHTYNDNYVNKVPHNYKTSVVLPSCTEQGYTLHTCTCGDNYKDTYVNSLGHDEINHNAKPATCTEEGHNAYITCSRCDYTTYQKTNKIPHDYSQTIIEPTCTEYGYTLYECKCGDSFKDTYVNPTNHAVSNVYIFNKTEHKKTCKCGEVVDQTTNQSHQFIDGYCTCGAHESITNLTIIAVAGGYEINYCKNTAVNVVIPEVYEGKPVISIANRAFYGLQWLTTIEIPESIKYIGDYVFYNCSQLQSIVLPEDLEALGEATFYGCTSLRTANIPNNITHIPSYLFEECTSLTKVTLPCVITGIGSDCFKNCTSLETTTYNNAKYIGTEENPYLILHIAKNATISSCSVHQDTQYIDSNAFDGCASLTNVSLPYGLKSIGYNSFNNCTALTTLSLPASLLKIDRGAFYGCSKLSNISLPPNLTYLDSNAFGKCSNLSNITIPSKIKVIASGTFGYCTSLSNISFPSGLEEIDTNAFYGCTALSNISLPNSLVTMGVDVFGGCTSLNFYTYNNAKFLGNSSNHYMVLVKSNSTSITSCTIPESTKIIAGAAFYDCGKLETITMYSSSTLKSIGSSAFENCRALKNLYLPDGMIEIGASAFRNCVKLEVSQIPASLTKIGAYAFYNCPELTTELTVPMAITEIEAGAFYNCCSLEKIIIHDKVTKIKENAFYSCSFDYVILPTSVICVEDEAFSYTYGNILYCGTKEQLESIELPYIPSSLNPKSILGENVYVYYYSETQPTESGRYWCYNNDGTIKYW